MTPTASPAPAMEIGSPAWAKLATASKVSAMVGVSPWESPFSLWQRMAGRLPWDVDSNDEERRGHYLEPAIRQWYREHQPTYRVEKNTTTWINHERPWQAASPDGLLYTRDDEPVMAGGFEAKSDNKGWEWGTEDTDEVPPHYRVQGLWQMDTLGLPFVDFAVLDGALTFRRYHLEYDPTEARELREQVRDFMDSVIAGRQPSLDSHGATYTALRSLHPDIEDTTVELDRADALDFIGAVRDLEVAQEALTAATSRIAAATGNARRAQLMPEHLTVATRISKAGGTPFLRRSNGLTDKYRISQQKEAS